MSANLLLDTDSYKASHYLQYPPEATRLSCYLEARGGTYSHTLFFGLQIFLKEVLSRPITRHDIDEAQAFWAGHGEPFNRAGWERVLNTHGGFLPVKIRAVPEGLVVPIGNVLTEVVNTDPFFPWLPPYLETSLQRAIWYPTAVATRSFWIKQIVWEALEKTCDAPERVLQFKIHDFGARGVSSRESAGIGGCAHLVNFAGTDTVTGVLFARKYYNEHMAGFAIPAAEHSTITAWGRENQKAAFQHIVKQFRGTGKAVSIVSDSYDIDDAVNKIWSGTLRGEVMSGDGTLAIRSDSGNPVSTPVSIIESLALSFGTTLNGKGYRVLNCGLVVVQSDKVTEATISEIYKILIEKNFSAENITFGIGGELLQKVSRDTLNFAMKASAIETKNGDWHSIRKTPAYDQSKHSKGGRLSLVLRGGEYQTIQTEFLKKEEEDILQEVFLDGNLKREQSFADVRALAAIRMNGAQMGGDN